MSVPVHQGATVVFVGDSITAGGWYEVAGGLYDQLTAQAAPAKRVSSVANGSTVGSVANGSAVGSVAPVALPIFAINSGVSGNKTSDIAAAVPARITNYEPSVVVLLVGINDVTNSVPEATIKANYDSILSQVRVWSGTVGIACISVLFKGEQWAAGPVWSNAASGGFDAAIDACNADIQSLCVTYGCSYIDMRSLALTYETVNNAPAPGVASGILTLDGMHPNPTGQLQMGNWGIGSFQVLP